MFEGTTQELALPGSQSHALSITQRNSVSVTGLPRPFWGVLSQTDFLTWKTSIRGLIHMKSFKHSQSKC